MAFASDKGRQGAAGQGAATSFSIDQSLRFNDDDSATLTKTFGTPTNQYKWTYSGWFKRCNIDKDNAAGITFLRSGTDTTNFASLYIKEEVSNRDLLCLGFRTGGDWDALLTIGTAINVEREFRDPSAWMHLVCSVDLTLAAAADRVKMYINGEEVVTFTGAGVGEPSQNYDTYINKSGKAHTIGRDQDGVYQDGYMAEVHFIDGTALTPTSFGETGDYGEWKPKEVTGLTYGTNGFYLDFKDSGDIGNDANGSNNWTANNLASTDVVLDIPSNNFCTWNPLQLSSTTLSEGNLKANTPDNKGAYSTFAIKHKAYWEVLRGGGEVRVGVIDSKVDFAAAPHSATSSFSYHSKDGTVYENGSLLATYTNWANTTDVIGFTFDPDTYVIKVYHSNVLKHTQTLDTDEYVVYQGGGDTGNIATFNFGQDSSFAGGKTTGSANANDGTYGDFYYTPPTDFLALCTNNLPAPAVKPQENFNTVLYTGDGAEQSITGVGFQPDLVWIKCRSTAKAHRISNVISGATKYLESNTTAVETSSSNDLASFDSDGFTVGDPSDPSSSVNGNGLTFVSWNWKAGGAGVSNTNGSITSTVSASVESGFSVVSFLGTGSNATVGHGLSVAPEMVIFKNREDSGADWITVHKDLTSWQYNVFLNYTNAEQTSTALNSTAPSTSLITLGNSPHVNKSGFGIIAYAFHSVEGYSKVGSYTGNGSADGTFVYTGFRPAYVMYKVSGPQAGEWELFDTSRDTYNEMTKSQRPNRVAVEYSDASVRVDFVSNGFKFRAVNSYNSNASGQTYVYLAFAEYPFKYTTAR